MDTDMQAPKSQKTAELIDLIERANTAYRSPHETLILSDAQYDACIEELRSREPNHPFLHAVEPESGMEGDKVRHARPMLSTRKEYDAEGIAKWCARMESIAADLGVDQPLLIRVTPKLDGMAARWENRIMASRGDGTTGTNITRMIERGLVVFGRGDGEIVMPRKYFEDNLADAFEHPRNVVVGAVGADTVKDIIKETLQDQGIHFVSYQTLPCINVESGQLAEQIDSIRDNLIGNYDYPVDGLIAEVIDNKVKQAAGSNSHHHAWMVAIKTAGDRAQTTIEDIVWQVGRSGRLTPVIQVTPTVLSGCTISKVTGHHAMNVLDKGLGKGAEVEIERAGEVIPYLSSVIKPASIDSCVIPLECPSCGSSVRFESDFLVCENDIDCPDRKKAQLMHFFDILGTIDLFGPQACSTLVEHGITSIREVFSLATHEFEKMGFGPGQAANLVKEIEAAKKRSLDDFRLLAAFGISHLGRGDSKKILAHIPIDILDTATKEALLEIKGFGEITATHIAKALPGIMDDLEFMLAHFENIVTTPLKAQAVIVESPVAGKHLVFTGSMSKSRDEMKAECESLSGIVQSGVNKKTDFLVIGARVGDSKLTKARDLGITILSEDEYRAMLAA